MQGSKANLMGFMDGADKRFIIPVYQRNYDWKQSNCQQLLDDLIKVIKHNRNSHFFGSIVCVSKEGGFNKYLIIDGQQRLTTISLLLLAMYKLIVKKVVIPTNPRLSEKIMESYLIDKYESDEARLKLKPIKNDSGAFEKLFCDNEEEYHDGSNITGNFRYFYDQIQKISVGIDDLFAALNKLEIINITLDSHDNPQLIFESLNSTGLALSEGDKIRNFILMGLDIERQNKFYEQYWNKIEICTNYEVSLFVRDYLSVKQNLIPAMSRVYFTFKAYVEELASDVEELLKDLLRYAKWYKILLRGGTDDKKLNACIYRLNRLETTVTRPFFLEVFRHYDAGTLNLEDVRTIFLCTENYLFRRAVCDLPTNALNKIFLLLNREITKYDGSTDNYLEKFKYALLSKRERGRFPDDDEFRKSFEERQIYLMNGKNKTYLFERFENEDTIEAQDIYKKFDDGDCSVEHIMPQTLTPVWIKELGDDFEDIHKTWVHRLANLTLTGYNSKYSNSSFDEKLNMRNGFKESHFYLNEWIKQQIMLQSRG